MSWPYNIDVACPQFLQTVFHTDEHGLGVFASVIAVDGLRILA